MNRLMLMAIVALVPVAAQELDLKFLNRLDAEAKESNTVTLGPEQLKGAGAEIKGLESMFVRSLSFGKKGVWTAKDFEQASAEVRRVVGCAPFIKTRDAGEMVEVYLCPGGKDEKKSLAVVSAEDDEFTVMLMRGAVDFSTLGKMDKIMGSAGGAQKDLVKRDPAAKKEGKKDEE